MAHGVASWKMFWQKSCFIFRHRLINNADIAAIFFHAYLYYGILVLDPRWPIRIVA